MAALPFLCKFMQVCTSVPVCIQKFQSVPVPHLSKNIEHDGLLWHSLFASLNVVEFILTNGVQEDPTLPSEINNIGRYHCFKWHLFKKPNKLINLCELFLNHTSAGSIVAGTRCTFRIKTTRVIDSTYGILWLNLYDKYFNINMIFYVIFRICTYICNCIYLNLQEILPCLQMQSYLIPPLIVPQGTVSQPSPFVDANPNQSLFA